MKNVTRFEDLVAWQLAVKLRQVAHRYCAKQEVLECVAEARERGYINEVEFDTGDHAARKALTVLNGLIYYLESTPNWGRE